MNQDEFRFFLCKQREEMLKHKWIASEQAGHDLGDIAIIDWIKNFAKDFRKQFETNRK